jgi:hypothetical protein
MATAPTGPQSVRPRRQMQEVKAPDMFQFSDQHRTASGRLVDIDQVTIKDKPTMQYLFEDDGKRRFTFLGTADLNKKIHPGHIGYWMDITYEGEDPSIKTQGSPMRRFKVQVSQEKEPGF